LPVTSWFGAILAALFLLILPGWALLTLLGTDLRADFREKFALSAGTSLALYPVLFLASRTLGIAPGPVFAWGPGAAAVIYLAARAATGWRKAAPAKLRPAPQEPCASGKRPLITPQAAWWIVLSLIFATRMIAVRGMTAPAWGDSVQHTFIVRLILDHGGLFQSWAPYAPIESLTYHFGFHAAASVWAWLTGAAADQAVLVCGQVLNVLAILTLYPLAVRLGGNSRVGTGAMIVAGLFFPMPGFFVNWGRYTQLAGMAILPAALWFLDIHWDGTRRTRAAPLALLALLALGLGLTHYSVIILFIIAAAAWTLLGLWKFRGRPGAWAARAGWLAAAGIAVILGFLPWAKTLVAGLLPRIFSRMAGSFAGMVGTTDFPLWKRTDFFFPRVFWITALIALAAALIGRRKLALPVIIWGGFSLAAANPGLLGLPGTGTISNEVLLVTLYIPISLLIGWAIGTAWEAASRRKSVEIAVLTALALFAAAGAGKQARIVDPFFQMVFPEDVAAFRWIRTNVPKDARFLVNGFLTGYDNAPAGSDAGWWLPYYTRRANTIPPLIQVTESPSPGVSHKSLSRTVLDVEASRGEALALRAVLIRDGITHVFLGARRGGAAYERGELVPDTWLKGNPDFRRIFSKGKAEVWEFVPSDRKRFTGS
jgi:hypothetical protein